MVDEAKFATQIVLQMRKLFTKFLGQKLKIEIKISMPFSMTFRMIFSMTFSMTFNMKLILAWNLTSNFRILFISGPCSIFWPHVGLMSSSCRPHVYLMSTPCQPHVNPMLICKKLYWPHVKSMSTPCRSILVNFMSTVRHFWHEIDIGFVWDFCDIITFTRGVDLMLIPCQPHVNPMSTPCRSHVNPMSTPCQPYVNLMSIPCQSHVIKTGTFS